MRAPRRFHVLLAGVALLSAGCGDRSPTDAGGPRPGSDLFAGGQPSLELLRCSPMPADTTVQVIGPAGGTLFVGPHALVVPAGALDTAVTITAVAPSDTVNRVRFEPEGLQFASRAALTMSYANCSLLGSLLPKRVAYTDETLAILEILPSLDHLLQQRVTGRLEHFSNYAVSW